MKHQWARIDKHRDLESASIGVGTMSGDIPLTVIGEGRVNSQYHAGMADFEFPRTAVLGSHKAGK